MFYAEAFATRRARRAFLREAVFFLMTPRFAALSIALYAAESFSFPRSGAAFSWSVFESVFTALLSAFFRRILKTRFLSDARCAFFADVVIAISMSSLAHAPPTRKDVRIRV